jgi:hypothetical protein
MSENSNSTKFRIQYCKQKTSVLHPFHNDLGKENRNGVEYTPFAIKNIQNYNPIYKMFFEMNENNYNSIHLNHKYKCVGIDTICEQNFDKTDKTIQKSIFMKYAPLLDPLRYLVGTYSESIEQLRILPSILENPKISKKLLCSNNSSYIDNFYCYLSSQLLNHHDIIHGIDYYGSALGIQEKYKFNVVDDLEY